jgi:YD repeat-containing protein
MRHLYDSLRACAKEEEVKAETRFDGTRVDCAYDAAGNRLAKTDAGGTVSYTLGAGDRLASWTGGSYSHDTAGCVTHIHLGGFLLKDQPRQWHQGRSRHHGCLNGRSEWDPNNANATIQGDVD